ncbi:MAG: ABC transporter permease [Chloroflexota bacterium]|nr:ABC transporter permease [Chloroflexota bacterium]
MIAPLTQRLLRRGLLGMVMLMVGMMLFQFVNPFIADSLGGPEGLESLVEQLPPAMQALAQLSPDFVALTGLAGYLSRGFDHPVFLILLLSAVIGFTGRAIAGEVDSGILALALSRPISRLQLYMARVLSLVLIAIVFGLAGPVASRAGLLVADPAGSVRNGQLLALAALIMLFAWAVGGLSLMVSAMSSSTGRVVSWATGYLVIAYFVDVFAELWSILEPLRPLSLFAWFDTSATMVDAAVPVDSALVLAFVGLVGIVVGWLVFRERDFMV